MGVGHCVRSMHTSIRVLVPTHAHAELRAGSLGSTSITLHLLPVHQLETHHGYGLNSKLLGSTGLWPRCWGNKCMELCPGFYMDIGDSNSGPHGSRSSAVTCEPSSSPPHPVNVFLFLSVYSLSLHLSCSFQGDRDPIFHGCHRHINFGTMIDTYQKSLNIQVLFIQFENYQTESVRDYFSKVPVSESLVWWHIKVWLLGRY